MVKSIAYIVLVTFLKQALDSSRAVAADLPPRGEVEGFLRNREDAQDWLDTVQYHITNLANRSDLSLDMDHVRAFVAAAFYLGIFGGVHEALDQAAPARRNRRRCAAKKGVDDARRNARVLVESGGIRARVE